MKERKYSDLITEKRNSRSHRIDAGSTLDIVDIIQKEDAEVIRAVRKIRKELAATIDMTADALRTGGRLIYVGAGTSGRLGVLDASESPPTYGTPPELVQGIIAGGQPALVKSVEGAEDDPGKGAAAVQRRRINESDIVLGISASGTARFVLGALEESKRRKAKTILLTFNPEKANHEWDLILNPVVGPEVITGSTRMKAGSATKLILNTITTGAMVKLGKVYSNLMVDLRATNRKLRNRAKRIIMELTGLDEAATSKLLDRANGEAKIAIVMHHRKLTGGKARKLLELNEGILRKVIGDL